MIDLLFWMFILFVAWQLLGSVLYFKYGIGKRWFHDVMGWCVPYGEIHADEVNMHSHCKYCNKHILQDSQGNWFPIE